MKILVLNVLLMAFYQVSFSQNWQLLGEDEIGDWQVSGAGDFTSAYYASETDQDSLWFMFTFDISNWDIGGDFGLALGVDTNLVIDDGIMWGGMNESMKTDIQYIFTRNGVFQTDIVNKSTNPIVAEIYESGTHDTLVFRFPLSAFDADGRFNVIAGTATFTLGVGGTVYEEIPSGGYFTVDLLSAVSEKANQMPLLTVYPNPTSQMIWVGPSESGVERLTLFDGAGKVIAVSNGDCLTLPSLENGIYLLGIEPVKNLNIVYRRVVILNND